MAAKSGSRSRALPSTAWGIIWTGGPVTDFPPEIEPAFLTIGSKPVLAYSLSAFERCADIEGVVIVTSAARREYVLTMVQMFGCNKVRSILAAPATRAGAIKIGLEAAVEMGAGITVIHEGVRPGVTPELITETIRVARKSGAAAVARPVPDPVCEAAKGAKVTGAIENGALWSTLTPQAFKVDVLVKALTHVAKKKLHLPDEAAAVVATKQDVHLVPSKRLLVRIAAPGDLNLAELLLRS
ncbi:MAG: 2-C-methyl-D-erythritol 4-phosphate cytidylyltransferase [Kiritimatiellae bacterium]|nr:2-C-methyl-D-erythritol 4-phosphate cytidylyltransferase [Kiritimatiellia bacterium]